MTNTLARLINRLVRPFGLRCVPRYQISRVPELPDRCLAGAAIVAERADILPLLPKGGRVAEVGVGLGRYSRKIIDVMRPAELVAIDTFELRAWSGPQGARQHFKEGEHEQHFRDQFRAEIADGLVSVRRGFSVEVLNQYPDRHFDMIYIDAAHDYENVRADLAVAGRKIKEDGYILMNDYTIMDPLLQQPYGIVQATHEFCLREGWGFAYLALHPYLFCDVALRKLPA